MAPRLYCCTPPSVGLASFQSPKISSSTSTALHPSPSNSRASIGSRQGCRRKDGFQFHDVMVAGCQAECQFCNFITPWCCVTRFLCPFTVLTPESCLMQSESRVPLVLGPGMLTNLQACGGACALVLMSCPVLLLPWC